MSLKIKQNTNTPIDTKHRKAIQELIDRYYGSKPFFAKSIGVSRPTGYTYYYYPEKMPFAVFVKLCKVNNMNISKFLREGIEDEQE